MENEILCLYVISLEKLMFLASNKLAILFYFLFLMSYLIIFICNYNVGNYIHTYIVLGDKLILKRE